MNIKQNFFQILILTFSVFFVGCTQEQKDKEIYGNTDSLPHNLLKDTNQHKQMSKAIKIFYNTPSPLEMATLLQRNNSSFYNELLSPVKNVDKYSTSTSQALNIGIYGVDLSYAKIFNQEKEWRQYLGAIRKLTQKLGIPQERINKTLGMLEDNISNSDTLLKVMNDTYNWADKYLKENERENIASFIILGGWIEALYIATNIYSREADVQDIRDRIVVQKYSLNTLIELVSKNQNDPVLAEYLTILLTLKNRYDRIKINYKNSDVRIDTINKVITLKGASPVTVNEKEIKEISEIVERLRNAIIR